MRRTVALSTLALLAAVAPAAAQPSTVPAFAASGAPGATAPLPPPPPDSDVAPAVEIPQSAVGLPQIPAPEPSPAERLVASDPSAGRAYLSPTGFTAARGTGGAQVWSPAYPLGILAAGTYAISNRIEIAAGGLMVLTDNSSNGTAGYLSAKVQVIRRRTVGIAVEAQYLAAPDSSSDSLTIFTAAASKCLGASCRTVITAHVSLFPTSSYTTDALGGSSSQTAAHILAGGSIVSGNRLKLVVDAFAFGEGPDHGLVVYGGLRRVRHSYSLDVGLVGYSDGDHSDVLPVPLAAAAFRF